MQKLGGRSRTTGREVSVMLATSFYDEKQLGRFLERDFSSVELVVERLEADPQFLSCGRLVAFVPFQCFSSCMEPGS